MINKSASWKKLQTHFEQVSRLHMRDLFADDSRRFQKFSCAHAGVLLDYSKNRITDTTVELLFELAREAGVEAWRDRLFRGDIVNADKEPVALHVMLRDDGHGPAAAAGRSTETAADKARFYKVCDDIRARRCVGANGESFRDVVAIGIGGSHLGAATVCRALAHLAHEELRVFFVSGVDARRMDEVLEQVTPERTLFVITSKTFATQETLINATHAKDWLGRRCGDDAWRRQALAVTTNPAAAARFGVAEDKTLIMPGGVGGRFSLWSAAGLPAAVLLGCERFEELLAGARSMDAHFAEAPFESNLPVILALLDIWYVNFHGASSRAVLPYDDALALLPDYLQQLEMESNGKSVDRDGRALAYATAPVVWGKSGLEGQHAFYQLLHQGGRLVPSDFIIAAQSAQANSPDDEMQRANFLAQTRALMCGDTRADDPRRRCPGNQPSNALVLDALTPFTLGALLALYEHKVFVQAAIWNIDPFDQWGVELGKRLAADFLSGEVHDLDGSTRALSERLRRT